MTFLIDKQELKPGLILFRRGDVDHDNWYCRIKLPQEDRYKTYALKTSRINDAKELAFDRDADVRAMLRNNISVFNHPFADVAEEYIDVQERRFKSGEITKARFDTIKSAIRRHLIPYVGPAQIHLVGPDRWAEYPDTRRQEGGGRYNRRNADTRAPASVLKTSGSAEVDANTFKPLSEWTIRGEMMIFAAIMNYAVKKKYIPTDHRFEDMPTFKKDRRDEFIFSTGACSEQALNSRARAAFSRSGGRSTTRSRTSIANIAVMAFTPRHNLKTRDGRLDDLAYLGATTIKRVQYL